MTEKTLVLEGLPADLDTIRPKLDLHFKNKRKSGGETLQIQDYPGDKRKALLVYHEDAALQKVLDRKCHKIDFKIPFGVVELQVKLKEDGETEVKKVKPPVFPRSTKDKLISLRKSSPNIEEKPASESLADSVTDDDIKLLLVRTTKEHEEDLLNLYFEQFASEEGGVSITRHEKNSWILKLSCQSDAEKVLAKKEHQYGISVEVYNETAVERKLDHRRFVLTGFNETCKCDIVSLFIGSCSQGADHAWETLDDGERIVVTFKQDIDIKSFLRKCLSKKFQGTEIRACRLPMTDSVLVQGDMKQIKGGVEEALNLYFSSRRSKGGAIRSQIWVTKGKSMVITFEDCHVAHQVAEHKHHFGGIDLTAQLFYSSLQKALTGQTALLPDIPTKVTLPLSTELLDFINRDETRKEEITTVLRRVHASVSFNTTTEPPLMEMDMTMENESLGMLRLFPTWERKAQREALALLEKYKEVQLPIEVEVWERIESGCLGLKTPGASISYRSTSAEIVLVCVQNEVKTLVEKIEHMVKRANDELERERNTLLRKIPLDSKEELDFVCDLVSGKLGDVGFYKDEESLIICLKGLENQVSTAEGAIKEALGNVEAKPLDISTPLMEFLKSLDLKKFEKNHFTPNNISSVFLLGDDSIQILAEKIDIQRAEDKLHKVIKEEVLKLTPGQTHVTKDKQWLQFFARLNGELKSTKNNNNVSISVSQEKIVVCGFSSVVADVSGKLRGYLDNKKPETADVLLKSVQEVQYVASCMNLSEVPEIKALGVTILPCKTQGSPCLKITAASDKIKEAFDVVKQQVSTIRTENYTYSEAGKSKVLEKNQVALQAKAKDLGCKLYLSPLITHCQKYSYDIEGCVTLTVGQGNISQHAADALICPLSSRLVFDNPIAKQFLQMGGPEIRKVCDKFLKERQTLQAGDVVLSNPGTLGAQHLIYAVIPIWGKASTPLNTVYLQSAVKNSLLEAENKKCVSIGMPVMGCGTFGFPVKESCVAVIKGILDFIYVDQKPPQLRSIFVIDSDAKTVREFQLAIEGKGYRRQQHNTPPPPPLAAKPASVIKVNPKRNLRPHKSKQAASTPQSSLPPNQVKIHGVRIEFRKGDITQETVRGIVNTTNADISLTVGVSAAIVKAAGSAVEQECKTICPLRADAAGVTSGGALQCDFILHILGPHSVADATLRVTKVLECCEDKQITTVSFPAVGTGGGGLSGTDSIGAILQGIQDHLSQCSSSTIIKLIYIVIYEDKILQEFQLGLNQWKTSQMVEDDSNLEDDLYGDEDDSDMPDTNSEEEDDTSVQTGNTIEAIIGPVKVKVVCGDITMEKTDAIVNSTNSSLDLNSGVSGAILKAAGQTVVDECKALGTQPSDGVVMTKPGNLKTKHIIHMVGQTKEKEITSSMLKVLKMCEDKKIQSVSFPALGTGAGNLGAVQVGNAMMAAIADLLISIRTPSVTTIHIVIFQAKMVKDFEEVMKKFKKVIPKPAAKTTRPAQPTPTKPALCLASATAAVVFPGMEAVVYGPSPASLSKVKKLLDELISEECISQDLPSSHLPQLLEAQKEAIVALSEKSQVRVLVASPDKMTVSGKKDDVLSAVLQIKDYLQGARDRESRKGEETRLRETVRWEAGEGETWGELDCSFSYDLELAFHRKEKIFKYNHQGETFTVDLKDMKQTDSKGTVTRVKRSLVADSDTAVIQFPQSWTRMEGKDLEIVTLAPNSGEYQRIEKEFIATSTDPNTNTRPTIQIVQIQRIQSKDQWQRYAVKKQAMDKKYPKNKNELNLYHGTTKDICQKINTCGFNRSFCGRNATMYGDGTYFAKEMWYSCHDTYSKPDASGLKYMYRARVLVGTPCLGVQGMKEPNPLNPADLHQGLHDCAVNDMQNPFIYVVFCDAGAYPDYIISFKTV